MGRYHRTAAVDPRRGGIQSSDPEARGSRGESEEGIERLFAAFLARRDELSYEDWVRAQDGHGEAEESLRRAISEHDADASSLVNLAVIRAARIEGAGGGSSAAAAWREAEEEARRGLAIDAGIAPGWTVLRRAEGSGDHARDEGDPVGLPLMQRRRTRAHSRFSSIFRPRADCGRITVRGRGCSTGTVATAAASKVVDSTRKSIHWN